MNEIAFELPEMGFVDRTLHVLGAKTESGDDLELLVNRRPIDEGKSLQEVVAERIAEARRTLRAYSVLFQRDLEVASLPGIDVGERWRNDSGMVYTREVHFAVDRVALSISGNVPLEEKDLCDACMEHVIRTVSIRD